MATLVTFAKKYWPTVVFIAGGLWAGFGTDVQHYISAHPGASAAVVAAAGVIAHLMPSPVAKS
jgi:hypothetical protein